MRVDGVQHLDVSCRELAELSSALMIVDAAINGRLPSEGVELALRGLVMGLAGFHVGLPEYLSSLKSELVPWLLH